MLLPERHRGAGAQEGEFEIAPQLRCESGQETEVRQPAIEAAQYVVQQFDRLERAGEIQCDVDHGHRTDQSLRTGEALAYLGDDPVHERGLADAPIAGQQERAALREDDAGDQVVELR